MRFVETCLYRLSLFACLLSAFYMTYLQFKYYLNNEDMASISYRKFNKEERDEYPSISICLAGYRGKLFTRSQDIFNSTNATREAYQSFLSGIQGQYPAQFSTVKYDDLALDILNYLISSREELRRGRGIYKFQIEMIQTFRDQSQICVSRNVAYRKLLTQVMD